MFEINLTSLTTLAVIFLFSKQQKTKKTICKFIIPITRARKNINIHVFVFLFLPLESVEFAGLYDLAFPLFVFLHLNQMIFYEVKLLYYNPLSMYLLSLKLLLLYQIDDDLFVYDYYYYSYWRIHPKKKKNTVK